MSWSSVSRVPQGGTGISFERSVLLEDCILTARVTEFRSPPRGSVTCSRVTVTLHNLQHREHGRQSMAHIHKKNSIKQQSRNNLRQGKSEFLGLFMSNNVVWCITTNGEWVGCVLPSDARGVVRSPRPRTPTNDQTSGAPRRYGLGEGGERGGGRAAAEAGRRAGRPSI